MDAALLLMMALPSERPNFLVLFVDDLGYDEINLAPARRPALGGYSGYGGRVQTPALAALAEEGMVFDSWYSGWHLCSPSRAACLTGRLPPRTGIDSVGSSVLTSAAVGGLPANETTFAEALRDGANYSTAMVGKWHLGVRDEFMPSNRGFQEYYGVPYSADMGLSPWWTDPSGWGPASPLVPLPLVEGTDTGGWRVVEQPTLLQNLTARYVERGKSFIARSSSSSGSSGGDGGGRQPWVLYMAFAHVHNPQFCGREWCGSSSVTGKGAAVPSGHGGTGSAVQEMDWAVGQLLAQLKESGVDEQTLVFFTSDNGAPASHDAASPHDARGGANAPLSGFKGSVLEGGIRMPAMARWPGKIAAGSRSSELVATYDIYATMLALAGVAAPLPLPTAAAGEEGAGGGQGRPRVIDGIDLSPVLLGRPGARGHTCLFQYYSGALLAAVRCGKYKLRFDLDPIALYDLDADVAEQRPLPNNTAAWAAVVANITAARDAHLRTVVPVQDQLALGSDARYALCAAPDSQARYPQFPNCTLNPENWAPPWNASAGAAWGAAEPRV